MTTAALIDATMTVTAITMTVVIDRRAPNLGSYDVINLTTLSAPLSSLVLNVTKARSSTCSMIAHVRSTKAQSIL